MIYNIYFILFFFTTIGLIFYHSKFIYQYSVIATYNIFSEKISWNKYVEKPRIFLHLLSLGLIWIIFTDDSSNDTFQSIIKLIIYLLTLVLPAFSYNKLFIGIITNNKKEKTSIKKSRENKEIIKTSTEHQTKYLLINFKKQGICSDDITENDYSLALKFNNSSKGIVLQLNNASIKAFYKHLVQEFHLSLNFKSFLASKSFLNSKGRKYNYDAVKNSNRTEPNYNNRLYDIFKNLPNN